VVDPRFETRVFPLAMKKTSISKPLDIDDQDDGEHVLQRPAYSRIRGHPYWIRPVRQDLVLLVPLVALPRPSIERALASSAFWGSNQSVGSPFHSHRF
jgi:hypothetical protein